MLDSGNDVMHISGCPHAIAALMQKALVNLQKILGVYNMSRVIYHTLAGTRASFEKNRNLFGNLAKIEGAEIYWGNGTIAVVASQEWCDYLHGKTDIRPEPQGDDAPFEFDEKAFMRFIGQEVR